MNARRLVSGFRLSWVAAVAVFAFLLGPFVVVIGASFDAGHSYHVSFPPREFSAEWYFAIPPRYVHAAGVSVAVGVVVAVLATVVGTSAALGIVRGRVIGKEALQAFFRLPVQIPLVVTGVVFMQFYYHVAATTGVNLLDDLWGLVIAHLFVAIPYSVGSVSSVLARMDPRIEEAADSLGATTWSKFWRVTFPLMRPGVIAGMFYAFIVSFGDVPIALFLVSSDHITLPVQIFQDMQFDFHPSMLAVSTIVVALSLFLIVGIQKIVGLDLVLPSGRR